MIHIKLAQEIRMTNYGRGKNPSISRTRGERADGRGDSLYGGGSAGWGVAGRRV